MLITFEIFHWNKNLNHLYSFARSPKTNEIANKRWKSEIIDKYWSLTIIRHDCIIIPYSTSCLKRIN